MNKYGIGVFIYSAGAYASYVNMNKSTTPIQPQANKKNISSLIAYNTRISHHYAKEFYINHCHQAVYIGTWPIIQFTIGSLSLFTGMLAGCLEWHEQNRK